MKAESAMCTKTVVVLTMATTIQLVSLARTLMIEETVFYILVET
jgi:hypothetical protein